MLNEVCIDKTGHSMELKGSKCKNGQSIDAIWVTRDFRYLKISEMTTKHLENSIAKCYRESWRMEAIPYLEVS